eukprot:scaffold880_cov132-Cylindrotheca_fusiformis.AAC.40
MPLHRRNVGNPKKDENSDTRWQSEGESKSAQRRSASDVSSRRRSILLGLGGTNLIFLGYVAMAFSFKSRAQLLASVVTAQVVALPVFLSLAIVLRKTELPHQRYIPFAAVATIFANLLPSYLSSGLANLAIVVFGLASKPVPQENDTVEEKGTKLAGPLGTVFAAVLMTSMLLVENFFIWVVSATYKDSQDISALPTPLQDNGQILLRYFFDSVLGVTKRDVVTVRNQINVEWILVAGLGLSLVALEMDGSRMRRNLWSVGRRALLTMATARLIRTFSFLITVLPSQHQKCYFSHFPAPPPKDWIPWLMVGFTPQANGGCNDLIISGHATVTSTLACLVTSVVGKPTFSAAIWMLVAMDYMVEIYEGYHYSVGKISIVLSSCTFVVQANLIYLHSPDMWLGGVLVNFIWTVLGPAEEASYNRQGGIEAKTFYPLENTTLPELAKYILPAIGSYLQLNGFIPHELANYTIVFYFLVVIFRIVNFGFEHYTQHILICVLFLAIGVYL